MTNEVAALRQPNWAFQAAAEVGFVLPVGPTGKAEDVAVPARAAVSLGIASVAVDRNAGFNTGAAQDRADGADR
jgi:hypothetical protein